MEEMRGSEPDSVEATIDASIDAAFEAMGTDGNADDKVDAMRYAHEAPGEYKADVTAEETSGDSVDVGFTQPEVGVITDETWAAMKNGKPLPKGEQGELEI